MIVTLVSNIVGEVIKSSHPTQGLQYDTLECFQVMARHLATVTYVPQLRNRVSLTDCLPGFMSLGRPQTSLDHGHTTRHTDILATTAPLSRAALPDRRRFDHCRCRVRQCQPSGNKSVSAREEQGDGSTRCFERSAKGIGGTWSEPQLHAIECVTIHSLPRASKGYVIICSCGVTTCLSRV